MSCVHRCTRAAAAIVAGALLAFGGGARADDTEVFVAPGDAVAGRSNILFIIDTSGSMDALVQTQAPWDPTFTFDGCYRTDAVYFAAGTEPPPCGSTAFITKPANRCAASRPSLDGTGRYGGFALGWDTERRRWEPLAEGDPARLLECRDDAGVDGDGTERWAANGDEGPWGPDDSQQPAWNTTYTLFDGNWLNWRMNPPSVERTRLEIVQEVVTGIVANLHDVNVGLMEFNSDEGGNVSHAVASVDTARDALMAAVDGMVTQGRTPLSETLYEAALYFMGRDVDYGDVGPSLSVPESRVNGEPAGDTYRSPVTAECQRNYIVLLTDGEPAGDLSADDKIAALPGFGSLVGACDGSGEGHCLDDLAQYLAQGDLSGLAGAQNAITYTIGFGVDSPLLEATARRGGGQYYVADDSGSLASVLTAVVGGIAERSGTFSAPMIPASTYNRATAERDVFVSVFQPTDKVHWPGNLKKYRFADNELVGQDGLAAVDGTTGFFRSNAFSFWSATPDGDRVAEGGAASRLPVVASRNLYTDLDPGLALSATGNRVVTANTALTAVLLGVSADERDRLIQWIRGADVLDLDADGSTTEPRLQMGDPLHVRPVTLNYGSGDNPQTVVFIATNDGLLHAVDAESGDEQWAWLPARLLGRQSELLADPPTTVRRYGLDGEIRLWIEGDDGGPGLAAGERAILFFGMGRGGDAVFAIDVTDRSAPRLLWRIDRTSEGLAGLGQTWAAPEVARVRIGDTTRSVVILSGGYDDSQDNRGFRRDDVGNAIYVLDALDGDLLWSAGAPDAGHALELGMEHSIPAAPRIVDLTGDGLADRMYVGDMGGRLWRFDFRNGNPAGTFGEGGLLASLGAADLAEPAAADVRRFYATPDVVFVNCRRGTFLAINIGSGYRGHPLDTDTDDAFFSVRDPQPFGLLASSDYDEPIIVSDLLDITTDPQADVPPDAAGWRLRLVEDPGEKSLTGAITFNDTIFFTSFAPGGSVSACVGGVGVNRAYEINACNGRPVTNLDRGTEPGPLGIADRFTRLSQTGIAPQPVLIFPATLSEGPTRCIGLACFSDDGASGPNMRRTYWTREPAR